MERAAVRYVMRHYGSKGWSARDVSSKNHGYDLKCKNYRKEHHVEVKGARGEGQRFVLTARELKTWTNDKQFVLAFVGNALSTKPLLAFFTLALKLLFDFALRFFGFKSVPTGPSLMSAPMPVRKSMSMSC